MHTLFSGRTLQGPGTSQHQEKAKLLPTHAGEGSESSETLGGGDLLLLVPSSPGVPEPKQISADAKLTSDIITWANIHRL